MVEAETGTKYPRPGAAGARSPTIQGASAGGGGGGSCMEPQCTSCLSQKSAKVEWPFGLQMAQLLPQEATCSMGLPS